MPSTNFDTITNFGKMKVNEIRLQSHGPITSDVSLRVANNEFEINMGGSNLLRVAREDNLNLTSNAIVGEDLLTINRPTTINGDLKVGSDVIDGNIIVSSTMTPGGNLVMDQTKVGDVITSRIWALPTERGNPIGYQHITTLSQPILQMAAKLSVLRVQASESNAVDSLVTCGVDVYKVNYFTQDPRSDSVQKVSGTMYIPQVINSNTIFSFKHGAYGVSDTNVAWRSLKHTNAIYTMLAYGFVPYTTTLSPRSNISLSDMTAINTDAITKYFASYANPLRNPVAGIDASFAGQATFVAKTISTGYQARLEAAIDAAFEYDTLNDDLFSSKLKTNAKDLANQLRFEVGLEMMGAALAAAQAAVFSGEMNPTVLIGLANDAAFAFLDTLLDPSPTGKLFLLIITAFYLNVFSCASGPDVLMASAAGNIVLVADGIGYGDSIGDAPLLHQDAEYFPVVDYLRAYRNLRTLAPGLFHGFTFADQVPVVVCGYSSGSIYGPSTIDSMRRDNGISQSEKALFKFKRVVVGGENNAYILMKHYLTQDPPLISTSDTGGLLVLALQVFTKMINEHAAIAGRALAPSFYALLPVMTKAISQGATINDLVTSIQNTMANAFQIDYAAGRWVGNPYTTSTTPAPSYLIPYDKTTWVETLGVTAFSGFSNEIFAGTGYVDMRQLFDIPQAIAYALPMFQYMVPSTNPYLNIGPSLDGIPFDTIYNCRDEFSSFGSNMRRAIDGLNIYPYQSNLDTAVLVEQEFSTDGDRFGRTNIACNVPTLMDTTTISGANGLDFYASNIALSSGNQYHRYCVELAANAGALNDIINMISPHTYFVGAAYVPLLVVATNKYGLASD